MRLLLLLLLLPLASCTCGTPTGEDPPDDPPVTPPGAQGKNVVVTDAKVRSCEAAFLAGGPEIPSVVFAEGVVGEFIPRAPRFALAFNVSGDVKDQEVARFAFTQQAPSPTLLEVRCYDEGSARIDNGLTIRD